MPFVTVKLIPIDGSDLENCKRLKVFAFSEPDRHLKLEVVIRIDEGVKKESSSAVLRDWILNEAREYLSVYTGMDFDGLLRTNQSLEQMLDLGDL